MLYNVTKQGHWGIHYFEPGALQLDTCYIAGSVILGSRHVVKSLQPILRLSTHTQSSHDLQ